MGPNCRPPQDWVWIQSNGQPALIYVGSKPLPPRLHVSHGFQPIQCWAPCSSSRIRVRGLCTLSPVSCAILLLTVASMPRPEAMERFFSDFRRFPPSAYENNCFSWRQDEWRQPRCQLMGWPAEVLSAKLPLELSCLEELALRELLEGTMCCFADYPVEEEVRAYLLPSSPNLGSSCHAGIQCLVPPSRALMG